MSKRILSLVLALVMLVLAVPVFALPALAEETTRTITFAAPSTKTGSGAVIATETSDAALSYVRTHSDADLAAAGLTITNADIIGWYTYDKLTDTFVSLQQLQAGLASLAGDLVFRPITWTSTFSMSSNWPLYSMDPSVKSEGRDTDGVSCYLWEGFSGGWEPVSYDRTLVYETFVNCGFNTNGYDAIFTRPYAGKGSQHTTGAYWAKDGNMIVPRIGNSTLTGVMYTAMASGVIDVTAGLTNAKESAVSIAIAVNNYYVYPEALKGKVVNPAANHADKSSFVPVTLAQSVTAEDIAVSAGDRVTVFYMAAGSGDNQPYPIVTASYQEKGTPLFTEKFRNNRPSIASGVGDGSTGSREDAVYPGNWDYIAYKSGTDMKNPSALTNRYACSTNAFWLLGWNETNYNSAYVYAYNPTSEASGGMWEAYGIGVGVGYVVGTRYTATNSGNIKVSFDRFSAHYLEGDTYANYRHVYECAIYVNGQKVWPTNGTDWHTITYYGANITSDIIEADEDYGATAVKLGTDLAAALNASMPNSLAIEKGQTVEFLLHKKSASVYDSSTETWSAGNRYAVRCSAHYVDGCVTYLSAYEHTTDALSNRPTNDLTKDIGDPHYSEADDKWVHNGNKEPIKYQGGWDYVVRTSSNACVVLDTRQHFSNYSGQTWFVPAGVSGYHNNYGTVVSVKSTTDATWPQYSMLTRLNNAIGTRYTAEHNGMVEVSFEQVLEKAWHYNLTTVTKNDRMTIEYAILLDGVKIWPADGDAWHSAIYYGTEVPATAKESGALSLDTNNAAQLNVTMPSAFYVKKGQQIEFLARPVDYDTYDSTIVAEKETDKFKDADYKNSTFNINRTYVDGAISYTKIYGAPTTEAGVAVDNALAIYGQVTAPAYATEFGVYIDGVKTAITSGKGFDIPVVAKDVDVKHTIQAYYVMPDGKIATDYRVEKSVADFLADYAAGDNAAIAKKAEAVLAYTDAAKAYFDAEAEAPATTAPTNHADYVAKGDSIGAVQCPEENKQVEFRGISLLLNDLINIKIVVNGTLPEGASLQIATNENFTTPETVEGKATSDGTGTKFVMEGISAQNWNTDYYIRVVDASGKAISNTYCYSVAAYYGRMISNDKADDKLQALVSSLMALYEAVAN